MKQKWPTSFSQKHILIIVYKPDKTRLFYVHLGQSSSLLSLLNVSTRGSLQYPCHLGHNACMQKKTKQTKQNKKKVSCTQKKKKTHSHSTDKLQN